MVLEEILYLMYLKAMMELNKPIFYDTDCLSSFLAIDRADLLKKEYSTIIISNKVLEEFYNQKTPKEIKNRLKKLIDENFVEAVDLKVNSDEFEYYFNFITNEKTEDIGKGELSAISLAIAYNGILASNNLSDVCYFVKII